MNDYEQFLRAKAPIPADAGTPVEVDDVHPMLFPHQRAIVQWAVKGGRRAIFAAFGLGKSVMQLETLRLVTPKDQRALIICPLGVRAEFRHDAEMLDIETTFVRRSEEVDGPGIYITNYESVRDGKLDVNLFAAVSLDEASVLRSFGSKTYISFLQLFAEVPYRFVATATPSPNRYKELIHYAGFLGVMDTGQALTRFFQRDSTQANNLNLYPHKEAEFWLWLSSWAVFLQTPGDLGYPDEGYKLPSLEIHHHEVTGDQSRHYGVDRDGQGRLVSVGNLGVSQAAGEKRETIGIRVAAAMDVLAEHGIGDDGDQVVIWCDLNDEQRAIEKALTERGISWSSVFGSLSVDESEARIAAWKRRETTALIGKPVMLGQGLNLQQCNRAVFVGLTFKFNDVIQATHRIYRFGQERPCHVHIVHTDVERPVVTVIEEKWERHREMTGIMSNLIREHGLNNIGVNEQLIRSIGVERVEVTGEGWQVANNDCVLETKAMDTDSVDLIVTSIPFSNHYEYTPCFDEQTEVLTKRGWISFGDLTMDDLVATANPESLALEWQYPRGITWQSYSGPMIRFASRNNFDLLVTPDHRMFVDKRVGNRKTGRSAPAYEFVTASEVRAQFAHRRWRMPTALTSAPRAAMEPITVPYVEQKHMPTSTIIDKLDPFDFAELAGWYLSEGSVGTDTPDKRGVVTISQSIDANPRWRAEIVDLMERIGLTVNSNNQKRVDGWSIQLAHFLRTEFGSGSYDKRIPRWVKDLDHDILVRLRDTMMKGDGNANGMAYTSVSSRLRDDFQEIALATGWRASISGDVVRIAQRSTRPEIREEPESVEYSGMIGCATLPNGTLVVRRNGKAIVSGNSYNDFGHTDNNDHFWAQMDYLTPELLRVLQPGRIYACHVKDRILFGNVTGAGMSTVSPFHAEAIMHGRAHGFDYMGMITITTDVVRENNQSYRLGWSENAKDSTKMGVGSPEYVLLFRKPQTDRTKGYADVPVTKDKDLYSRSRWQVDAHAFWRSNGDRPIDPSEWTSLGVEQVHRLFRHMTATEVYDWENHVRIGEAFDAQGRLPATFMLLSPESWHPDVWADVNRMLTLNGEQSRKAQAMHVCPLQFDIVDRLIGRYSNPGELVYDPFGGLFTVPYRALLMDRRGRAAELNPGYFLDGVKYLQAAERKKAMPSLFDVIDAELADVPA